jgi:hypothetical protein
MKAVAAAGGGRFIIGRSGYKTRLEWAEGVAFAEALATADDCADAPRGSVADMLDETRRAADGVAAFTSGKGVDVVASCKAALARVYNTEPDKVRITVEV